MVLAGKEHARQRYAGQRPTAGSPRGKKQPCQFPGCKYSHHRGLRATEATFAEVSQEEMPEIRPLQSLSGTRVACAVRWLRCTLRPESFRPRVGEKGHLVPTLSARCCTVGSKPRAHAIEFVEVQEWEENAGGWLWGCLFCVSFCPLQLGTPRGQKHLFSPSLPSPCTP